MTASFGDQRDDGRPTGSVGGHFGRSSGPTFDTPPVVVPSLALPKGSASHRGLGEPFQVSAFTGTGGLTIPITTSPGRGGSGPSLSLRYDSGRGNGPFGMGVSASPPSISRRTDRGLPWYHDDDRFMLTAVDDLVPALVEGPQGWQQDTREEGDYRILRFRPRIEAGFSRIERWRQTGTGEGHWRVTDRNNVTSVFGRSASARVVDPKHVRHEFQWMLERVVDDRGNVALYEYIGEDNQGARGPAEMTRRGAQPQRYLKRIRYGNRTPAGLDEDLPDDAWMFEVVFDYGDHGEVMPGADEATTEALAVPYAADRPWSVRADPFSSYRSMFEIRTRRLCRRVLMFHRFGALSPEAPGEPVLVASTDLEYASSPVVTLLTAVSHRGYVRRPDGLYDAQATPPLRLSYATPKLGGPSKTLDPTKFPGARFDGEQTRFVDLDGEGMPGVLVTEGRAWWYGRSRGGGAFHHATLLPLMPTLPGTLVDIDGSGRLSLSTLGTVIPGTFPRTDDGWGHHRQFLTIPRGIHLDRTTAVDFTGDGLPDLVAADMPQPLFYPSRGHEGWGSAYHMHPRHDMPLPSPSRSDPQMLVTYADMTGDGLLDIVRIDDGSVTYWPNLGMGHFGEPVIMGGLQPLAPFGTFRAEHVRLADLDGSGTADLIYFDGKGAQVWINAAGNGFMPMVRIANLPSAHTLAHVDVIDIEGAGVGCLVWSASTGSGSEAPRYVKAFATKPYLLESVTNGRGGETRLTYVPSTQHYVQDRDAGRPWATRLPMPVHVVERVETIDHVTGHRMVSTYRYRHGYFDGREREFRGFGMVEQRDAESLPTDGAEPLDLPPVVTKTWFETGMAVGRNELEPKIRAEYWSGDRNAVDLVEVVVPKGNRTPGEWVEAHRAAKGSVLRQEVYGEDGTYRAKVPYTVTERTVEVRMAQPRQAQRVDKDRYQPAAFSVFEREALTYHYERRSADPRVTQSAALEVDAYGTVTRAVTVGYPRRGRAQGIEQKWVAVVAREAEVVHQTALGGPYRLAVPVQTRTFERRGIGLLPEKTWTWQELATLLEAAPELVPFETPIVPGDKVRRLLSWTRAYYYTDDLTDMAPLGEPGLRALPYESRAAALSEAQREAAFGGDVDAAMLEQDGGYPLDEGLWWARSARHVFDPAKFCLPTAVVDPFGEATHLHYDDDALLLTSVVDPKDNVTSAVHDYRVLQPSMVTDPNGNRIAAAYDGLGQVRRTAIMGQEGEPGMDSLDEPTAMLDHDLWAWTREGAPVWIRTRAREHHGPDAGRWIETFAYADGRGQALMTKTPAQPGTEVYDAVLPEPVPRWIGSGRTIRNNKGLPVRQYEPFFSTTSGFESETELVQHGVTPLLYYDPLGRLIRTELPNGTQSRVEITAWEQRSFDANDAVLGTTWHTERMALPEGDPERRAAQLTEDHADTPTVTHLDHLGRPYLVIEHHRDETGADVFSETRVQLDVQGNVLQITDANGTIAETRTVGMLGQVLLTSSIEVGQRRAIADVTGAPLWSAGSRGFSTRHRYDAARRPTHTVVTYPDGSVCTVVRVVYGEVAPDASAANLRGRVFRTYDGAGLVEHSAFDVDGNLVRQSRRLAVAYDTTPCWSVLDELSDPAAMDEATTGRLEDEVFTTEASFDALGRPRTRTTPDASVVRLGYGDAGHLETVAANVRGAETPTGIVDDLRYDARGRRTLVVYGNGTRTRYTHDPLTFRLTRLRTDRIADGHAHQDLRYTHDPVGNITEIRDAAQLVVFTSNAAVSANQRFVYDARYRLTHAEGREHGNQGQPTEAEFVPRPGPEDPTGLREYVERYLYDLVGNVLEVQHQQVPREYEPDVGWTRRYQYDPPTQGNRLLATSLPTDAAGTYSLAYAHDAHGNMTAMPHLASIGRDFADRMQSADLDGGGTVFFTYDAAGERVHKIRRNLAGSRTWERIYLGGFELYRERVGPELRLERETLHVADDTGRVCMVETKTVDAAAPVAAPNPITRYQYGNHLGTVGLELDGTGQLISYEEFHPYGTTAYRAANAAVEVSASRFRYTGRERDEETGLGYHGARYYASWLGRWTAADPIDLADGPNRYRYARNRPTVLHDPSGLIPPVDVGKSEALIHARQPDRGARATEAIRPSIPPEAEGPIEVMGGTAQVAVGVGLVLASDGLLSVIGYAIILDGLDHVDTGRRTINEGHRVPTRTTEAIRAGLSSTTDLTPAQAEAAAEMIHTGVDLTFDAMAGRVVAPRTPHLPETHAPPRSRPANDAPAPAARDVGTGAKSSPSPPSTKPPQPDDAATVAEGAGKANTTRTGVKRTNAKDWRKLRDVWDDAGYGDILSEVNRKNIAAGRTPVVDDAWIKYFPGDAPLKGEKIPMHHIGGSKITVPLPESRHLDAHMPGGFRYNPGGPGQTG